MSDNVAFDIVIVGGATVGSLLACSLAQQDLRIALIEPHYPAQVLDDAPTELRVSAISPYSQEALENIGAWHLLPENRISPYEFMHVWDGTGDGKIHFSAADMGIPCLGHIIENTLVQSALHQRVKSFNNINVFSTSLNSYTVDEDEVSVLLDNDVTLSAKLIIGADGVRSKVRELAGIDLRVNPYFQKGLVAVVETDLPHQDTAWQRFLPTGPLAFLPLANGTCSIVWTLPSDQADYYLKMSEEDFNRRLTEALGNKLGSVRVKSQRAAFPLSGRQAESIVQKRVALVGDAAHTIHPLAGQGVNLGIKDALGLVSVLTDVVPQALGDYDVLRRYERSRRGENLLTEKTMEGFKLLFGNTFSPIQILRNTGLNMVDQLDPVKHSLMRHAMGL
ncbi:MAG: 2-octaprenyl-3-methyl-6-methoxy-1,4-benzoquinol hydroxylase (EC [uncultured Thiotrichaceae bacterium]|uniref:2-octaprenyl-3-methyl-6-methoxy-1,4-benzoquinol hydroxylase (EC) n=1 Tax=uncultured Thiotrichaceae bacterium TaxID=298394 RepID=A0A6S6S0F4_9GAMM|nr:MAG: 2-octaprenyl-3-methyl-6-methoxy-1,4-benzoquinol hydroxylase (EC [uncultured Thiotrichaceae bacterium]